MSRVGTRAKVEAGAGAITEVGARAGVGAVSRGAAL